MKSFNPTSSANSQSPIDSQSNIVPFKSRRSAFRLRQSTSQAVPADSIWTRFWDQLFKLLVPDSQPRITQIQEPDGNEYYQVYDPATGNSRTFGSELETRIWLDRRFYDNSRNW